ncbi:MAG TPA: ADOP family duplicated permease [Vicinamibacteria bacterium]|nr:ADOP family duplicated permease [Vicinamibacteria bacterium]
MRNLFRKGAVEQGLDEELRASVEILAEEGMRDGLSAAAARRQALIALGGVEQVKEEVRAMRAGRWLEDFARDLRYALRTLARAPGFTVVAVLTLALGIGTNIGIFTLLHDLVFSSRPYPNERQVVQLYTRDKRPQGLFRQFSYPTYLDIREDSAVRAVFSDVMAHAITAVGVGEGEGSRRSLAAVVSANYFRTFGMPMARGRDFLPEEERPGRAAAAVVASYSYWKKTGFDLQLVGKTIRVNERRFTVVGIAPERFTGTMVVFGPELYFPLGDYDLLKNDAQGDARHSLERRDLYDLYLVGRLKPGVNAAAAGSVLKLVAARLEEAQPAEQKDQTFLIGRLPRLRVSTYPADESSLTVMGLMLCALAGIVLLIACLNLANVLLARGVARRKDVALRLAIGAGRGRIIRQLLTEGLVLSLAGAAGGYLIGLVSSNLSASSIGAHMPVAVFLRGGADPAVLMATLGFAVLAVLFFALGPALKLTRADLVADLKERAGQDAAPRRRRFLPRNPLVMAQIALSLGLVTVAGLFIRGALKAGSVETGLRADSTLLIEADASLSGYDQARSLQLYRAATDRLAGLPGVEAASIASVVPFGTLTINRPVGRAGVKAEPDAHPATAAEGLAFRARWNSVGSDYFRTLGLPVLRGRPFTKAETEVAGAPAVAIVDEVLAKKLWPGGDAVGQLIQWAERDAPTAAGGGNGTMGSNDDLARAAQDPRSVEIVGIVPATRSEFFESEVGGQVFVPFAQGVRSAVFFQVRMAPGAPRADAGLFDLLRREVRLAAPGVPVFTVRTFAQHVDASPQLWIVRSGAYTVSVFAGLALALAIVGVYGVMAYAVVRRTREIGIRRALGAETGEVLRMILREGLIMTFGGAVLGLLLALVLARGLGSMLYQVSPVDPVAFSLAPAVLVATAVAACWVPARRAAKVAPMVALRFE